MKPREKRPPRSRSPGSGASSGLAAQAVASLGAAALAACAATGDPLAAARESWRGATYDEVLRAWGPPAQSAADSHTWFNVDAPRGGSNVGIGVGVGRSGGSTSVGIGVGGILFGSGGEPPRCDRTLAFRDGVVVAENWVGDPGYCSGFARRK